MIPYEFIIDDNVTQNDLNENILDEIYIFNGIYDFESFPNSFEAIDIINSLGKPKIFKIIKMQNHGRKRKRPLLEKEIHKSTDYDNILCKLQIHFFNFLVNFANDSIKVEINNKTIKKLEFKNIKHEDKIQISTASLERLIRKQISNILQLNISKKYRKLSQDEDYNKNIYEKVIALSEWLKKLFDMNYLDAFKLYYNDCQLLESFEFKGKIIKFSKKTKSFFFHYDNARPEEKREKLKFIARDYYLKLGDPKTFKIELSTELLSET